VLGYRTIKKPACRVRRRMRKMDAFRIAHVHRARLRILGPIPPPAWGSPVGEDFRTAGPDELLGVSQLTSLTVL
jgi:hypothetical protein